jgi:DNA-binding MarR family transcriptional regulator
MGDPVGALVSRVPSPDDKRVVRVHVTERGHSFSHLSDFHERVNARLLKGISDREAELLFDLLRRVDANARAES